MHLVHEQVTETCASAAILHGANDNDTDCPACGAGRRSSHGRAERLAIQPTLYKF